MVSKYDRRRKMDPRLACMEKEASRRVEIEYRSDILKHLKEMEQITSANAAMIDMQPELEWFMRPHLLDFLIDTHASFGLKPEVLFLAINLIDRYCSTRVVYKKHYQLVGCTALWIAAKFEDKSRTPTLSELERLCCSAYNAEMFVQMELHVLNTLEWSIGHPTIETFLAMCLGNHINTTVAHVSRFLCELSLYPRSFVGFSPSVLASSSFTLAMIITGHYPTIPSNISQQEIQCISLLSQCMKNPGKSLSKKYARSTYGQVATLVCNYIARQEEQQQQQQQGIAFPPTPPQRSSSPQFGGVSTPYQTSPHHPVKNDLHIQSGNGFSRRTEGYLTPPCTPADQVEALMSRNYDNSAYQSVPMETTRACV